MTVNIAILGSTGSIGRQTLEVVERFPERFNVVGLAAGNNLELLEEQIQQFRPRLVSTANGGPALRTAGTEFVDGQEGLTAIATMDEADIVVAATSGHSAIEPTLKAIQAGKQIALANKEAIVCAGDLLIAEAGRCNVQIRPVDSEHSAIWQCMMARSDAEPVRGITLTASGGALRNVALDELEWVTVKQAMAHPNWSMGSKITIDSATLMNKGLEVIEAHWLFDLRYDQIDVVIHPQSLVHSFVTFCDGSVIAQLGLPDMRVPIQFALSYPDRLPADDHELDLISAGRLEFQEPDHIRFPGLEISRQAGIAGDTYPTVLSAADEIAVAAFIAGQIGYLDIVDTVRETLERHAPQHGEVTLEKIADAYDWACATADSEVRRREAARRSRSSASD